ncbi:peptide-methionine (S)-S-oxide reductase [Labrys sp. WJW]|nr:peptide-methionine (S)-S-oxide reductase [Labrys sp. WJW]
MKRRGILFMAAGLAASLGTGLWFSASSAEEAPRLVSPPTLDSRPGAASEMAVLAGGCFWGVQGVFQHVKGVSSAVSGYAGGTAGTARYETVSTGSTGHAEAVRIRFDPRQISYGQILQIYFSVAHDPTQLNRQGPDSGTQYRSQIFTTSAEQARIAAAYVSQLDGAHSFASPIVTRIAPLQGFFPAEAYHQDYLTRHPTQPYIAINDLPKVAALRQLFPAVYRNDPVLVAGR